MDDTKTFKIEFDGETLEARAITPDQIASLAAIRGLGGAASIRVIGAMISYSLGAAAYETMVTGLAAGTMKIADLMDLLKVIATESSKTQNESAPTQNVPTPEDNHSDVPATFRSGQ